MAGAGAVPAIVGGRAAVGDVDPTALRDEPAGQQDRGHGLAAAALADDQGQGGRELAVVGIEPLDRPSGIGGSKDQPTRTSASARRQRDAMGDVPLGVATSRAERVDAEWQRGSEALQGEVAAADDACVRQGVEVRTGLLDDSVKALCVTARVSQRAVDPDLVDGRPDLCGQLGIHYRRLLKRVLLIGADEPVAALLVANRCTQALPAAALAVLFPRPHAHADVDGQRRREGAAEQVGKPRRVGRQGRGGEVNRLLERAVLVAQPRGMLADVDRSARTPADRPEDAVTKLRRFLEARRVGDLARCRELHEQSLLLVFYELGGGVKALPQQ